jgi:DnaJ like chaperone protein
MSYGKIFGGFLGWAVGGPIGGIIGVALGAIVDSSGGSTQQYNPRTDGRYQSQRHHTQPGDFSSALLVLSAAVMKADGKHMRSELDFIRTFYARQFGEAVAQQQMAVLKNVLEKEIPLKEVCDQIRYFMEHPMRLQLLHYLFGLASADGQVDSKEVEVIERISNYMGISKADYESIRAMFYKDPSSAYKILEIEESATDEEVKKAYRKMAVKYHPDKVRDLGEQHQKAAQEKFIKVQEAYETIRKKRGMK